MLARAGISSAAQYERTGGLMTITDAVHELVDKLDEDAAGEHVRREDLRRQSCG